MGNGQQQNHKHDPGKQDQGWHGRGRQEQARQEQDHADTERPRTKVTGSRVRISRIGKDRPAGTDLEDSAALPHFRAAAIFIQGRSVDTEETA